MKTIKKVFSFALIFALIMCVCACGNSSTASNSEQSEISNDGSNNVDVSMTEDTSYDEIAEEDIEVAGQNEPDYNDEQDEKEVESKESESDSQEEISDSENQDEELENDSLSDSDLETPADTDNKEEDYMETESLSPDESSSSETIAPMCYEDNNVEWGGYSNYIDVYGATKEIIRITICDHTDSSHEEEVVSGQKTYRGIGIGDSREKVIEKYGEPDKEVPYQSQRYIHGDLKPQYNMCYNFIDERYPEVFFGVAFNMDQNDNVLHIFYEPTPMKWY